MEQSAAVALLLGFAPMPSSPIQSPVFQPSSRIRAVFSAITVFTVMALLTAVYVVVCLLLLPSRRYRIYAGNAYGKLLGRTVFSVTGIRPTIAGHDRIKSGPPAIFVCNHTATIDMWVGMWACPFGGCGTAKKEIVKVPIFGLAYLLSGHLLLDRSNRERAIASMNKVAAIVRDHRLSLWMWPEGTRSRSGRLIQMKKGFAHLAIATGLPVVPVVFHDADLRWPGGSLRPSPGRLRIEVLPDIDTSEWTTESVGAHSQELWSVFQDALGERQMALPEPIED